MDFKNKFLVEIIDEDSEISEDNTLAFADQTGWRGDGGKYEHRDTIFSFENRFYKITDTRSGSYFSDYYYDVEDWLPEGTHACKEVERIPVTENKWVVKP